jgi:hypothetical protein
MSISVPTTEEPDTDTISTFEETEAQILLDKIQQRSYNEFRNLILTGLDNSIDIFLYLV